MTTFGSRLKKLREKRKLTLEQLGEKVGSSKSYIWELENKPTIRPSVETADKLARALDTTIAVLMGQPEDDDLPEHQRVFFRNYQDLDEPDQETLHGVLDVLRKKKAGG